MFSLWVAHGTLSPRLKGAGFRKSGTNYHRRLGEAVQVVSAQVSHGSSSLEKTFYINVGIAFDAICDLAGVPVLERPKEYECDDRGTRGRLEELIADAPKAWILRNGDDAANHSKKLGDCVDRLCLELDGIVKVAAYRRHRWFDRFRPIGVNAQVLYLLGDVDGAWKEIQDLAVLFSDRRNANLPEWWIEKLGLIALKNRSRCH